VKPIAFKRQSVRSLAINERGEHPRGGEGGRGHLFGVKNPQEMGKKGSSQRGDKTL